MRRSNALKIGFSILIGMVAVFGVMGSSYSLYIYTQKVLNNELDQRITLAAQQVALALEGQLDSLIFDSVDQVSTSEVAQLKFLVCAVRTSAQLETLTIFDLERRILLDGGERLKRGKRLTHLELPYMAMEKVTKGKPFFSRKKSIEDLVFRSASVPIHGPDGVVVAGVYAKANIFFEDSLAELRENWVSATLVSFFTSLLFVLGLLAAYRRLAGLEKVLEQRARLDLINQMTAGIAHDIKNPLSSISMSAQLLEEDLQDQPESQETLQFIHTGCATILEIVENLLGTGRTSTAKDLALNEFVGTVVRQLQSTAKQKSVSLEVDIPDDVWVFASSTPLRMALANVLHNGIQAVAPECGLVQISLRKKNGLAGIVVSDNGPGIPTALQKTIFDPMVTTKEEGSGLGLPTAKQILEDMNGELELETNPEPGTVFILWVPSAK